MNQEFVDGQGRGHALACQGGSRNRRSRPPPDPSARVSRLTIWMFRTEQIWGNGSIQTTRVSRVRFRGMELFWWSATLVLMAVGLIGTVLPVVPGTTLILAAAILHRIMLGPEKSLGWASLGLLVLLTLVSYAVDFIGSWMGARRFGATRWGGFGAVAGGIVGIFFGLPGLLAGPVLGALAGEIFSGMKLIDAGRASWGALLGNLAAMAGKLGIALAMVSWFLVATPAPF